jgi:hypothetical protein
MMSDTAKTQPPAAGGDDWLREYILPEEFLLVHYPSAAGSYHRRFESPNVVDLVRVRRERAKQQAGAPGERDPAA